MWWIIGGLLGFWALSKIASPPSSSGGGGSASPGGGGSSPGGGASPGGGGSPPSSSPPDMSNPLCAGVPPIPAPKAGAGTGFAALPDDPLADLGGSSWKSMYEAPMKLTKSEVSWINQESAAMGAEELAKQLSCNGYSEAADMLLKKAAEIRSWDLGSF